MYQLALCQKRICGKLCICNHNIPGYLTAAFIDQFYNILGIALPLHTRTFSFHIGSFFVLTLLSVYTKSIP